MKQFFTFLAAVLLTATTFAQVGINTETPDPSAALDITSTTGGFLMPRMTNAERLNISEPALGLQVFVTDFDSAGGSFMIYDGSEWKELLLKQLRTIPNRPIIGTATAGDGKATVLYTKPNNDGGSEITYYTATSNPGGFTGTKNGSGSGSITVTGLTNDTPYTFTVKATNSIGTSLASNVSNALTGPEIGDFYGGGVVFYRWQSGDAGYVEGETHGLIAAVEDQSSGIRWYNGSNVTTGATATSPGTGSANTDTIIAVQGVFMPSYAAGLARSYNGGGYTDWFLPSKISLNWMYNRKGFINPTASSNGGSSFTDGRYWSSSETAQDLAWRKRFADGQSTESGKTNAHRVRAVRAF